MIKHTEKAVKSTIQIAEIVLEVFTYGDGEFFLSQTQTANAVKKPQNSITSFLRTKRAKALMGEGFTLRQVESKDASAGFVSVVPINLAHRFWRGEDKAGNEYAEALIDALMAETLERKCSKAFSLEISEKEIAAKAIAAYRETLFGRGNLNNAEYVELCKECREDHGTTVFGF